MNKKPVVFQLITWEKRKSYFDFDLKDGKEYDLLHIGIPQKVSFWRRIFGKYEKQYLTSPNSPFIPHYRQFAVWVQRPHDFKLGDEVEVQVNITKVNVEVKQ